MQQAYSKQSIGTSLSSSDHHPASSMELNDANISHGSNSRNDAHEPRLPQEMKSDETPPIFVNKPARRGKWTPEEERYAHAIIEAFEEGILQGVKNGCTLRSYLSVKLHCAPMRISKKFAGRCIGKQVFSPKAPNAFGPLASTSNGVQETMNKIRRLEQQFNISVLEEEGSMTTHLDLMPSASTKVASRSTAFNIDASNTNHENPLPSLLLQSPYTKAEMSVRQDQMKTLDVAKNSGQNQVIEKPKSDAITELFEAYQQAQIYHGIQQKERNDDSDQNSKGSGTLVSDSSTKKDSLVSEHDKQVWWNDTATLLMSLDKSSNYQFETPPSDVQTLESNSSSNHSDSNADSTTFWTQLKKVSKMNLSDPSNPSSNKSNNEISEPASFSAADEYAIHARQSVIEVSKHSAYCKPSVQSKTSQSDSEPMIAHHTASKNDASKRITHAVSMNKDLELYSIMLDNIQQTDTRLKSDHSDLGPNTVSGSDRSSDNCSNPYDGSSGSGSQNGISTGTSDMDNSDTGSDEASIVKKKHNLDATILHNSEPLLKRVKQEQ